MTPDRHDLRHALVTLLVGTALGVGTTLLILRGTVPLPTAWPGPGRVAAEVVLYVLLFDAYFYALHRLLHTGRLFRRVHAVHHRSSVPTVVTALAFHPAEALLIMGFMPVMMWLAPIHLASFVVVSVFLSGSIVLAHSGWDVFPSWWRRAPVLAWYVTPDVHAGHHRRRDCNFSATFSLFDRLFGTYRATVTPPAPSV